jgi:hypothetical protein
LLVHSACADQRFVELSHAVSTALSLMAVSTSSATVESRPDRRPRYAWALPIRPEVVSADRLVDRARLEEIERLQSFAFSAATFEICECRCGAPGWRTTRLGVGDPA